MGRKLLDELTMPKVRDLFEVEFRRSPVSRKDGTLVVPPRSGFQRYNEDSDLEETTCTERCDESEALMCGTAEEDEKDAKEARDPRWISKLPYTEQVKIGIARALLMNSEVMVFQRPLHHFGARVGDDILRIIKKHVRRRGMCPMKDSSVENLRPRTCFLTPERLDQAKECDVFGT